jgi:hypothetical protein
VAPNVIIGQDWTDVLAARSAGLVPGFAAHGAPIETADIAPADREDLGIEHFVAVQPPSGGDWRDQKILELEVRLAQLTGAPVDPRDRRLIELQSAIDAAAAGHTEEAQAVLGTLTDADVEAIRGMQAGGTAAAPASTEPPADLGAGHTPTATEEANAALREALEETSRALAEARNANPPQPPAPGESTPPQQ